MKTAFTLIELLVVITIIVVLLSLLSLLTPALDRAMAAALRARCGANERRLSLANHTYASEFRDQFVPIAVPLDDGTTFTWVTNEAYLLARLGISRGRVGTWVGSWWPEQPGPEGADGGHQRLSDVGYLACSCTKCSSDWVEG